MPYLIDGHNLIPPSGLRLDSPDDELELLAKLQEFARLSRREIEVYFDGSPARGTRTKRIGRLTAHFVSAGTTADAAIKGRLRTLGRAARNWTVVSSDHEVRQAALAAHARAVSSQDFARGLEMVKARERGRMLAARSRSERLLSGPEVEEWLRLFEKRK